MPKSKKSLKSCMPNDKNNVTVSINEEQKHNWTEPDKAENLKDKPDPLLVILNVDLKHTLENS